MWGDRIELGMGLGHRQNVSAELGMPFQSSLSYLKEYSEAIRAVISGESFVGRHLKADTAVRRTRLTPGSPPLLIAALGPRSAEHAASYADGVILTWTPPSLTSDLARRVHGRGRSPATDARVWVILPCFLDGDLDPALGAARRSLAAYLRLPAYGKMIADAGFAEIVAQSIDHFDHGDLDLAASCLPADLVTSVAVVGGRQQLDQHLSQLSAAGVDEVILYPLPVNAGWRGAVDAVLAQCSPSRS
jgi:alkanesulfonate monooxygenase SsuD/methylene tetrahydromethanopterin reductase-like flavin-dependent oxidoreductase (luciferase family)